MDLAATLAQANRATRAARRRRVLAQALDCATLGSLFAAVAAFGLASFWGWS